MLKVYKSVRKGVPVTVLRFEQKAPLLDERLQRLRCTCCGFKLGARPWGSAWIRDDNGERGARLCAECCEEAASDIAEGAESLQLTGQS